MLLSTRAVSHYSLVKLCKWLIMLASQGATKENVESASLSRFLHTPSRNFNIIVSIAVCLSPFSLEPLPTHMLNFTVSLLWRYYRFLNYLFQLDGIASKNVGFTSESYNTCRYLTKQDGTNVPKDG